LFVPRALRRPIGARIGALGIVEVLLAPHVLLLAAKREEAGDERDKGSSLLVHASS